MLCGVALLPTVATGAPQDGEETGFDVAVTVDDLPPHGDLHPGMTRGDIARAFLQTWKAHHVGQAFGVVNAQSIGTDPAAEEGLTLWRQAGYPLANHMFSHANLDDAASPEAWEADVRAGEPMLEKHMGRADWHWLRFPNLAAGNDPARHASAVAFLRRRGYRIASVSLAFADWDYGDAYARCVAQRDECMIAAMKRQYLDGVDHAIARARAVSMRVYGRMVPQVLLTHVGTWTAATLPDVMARLDAAGARYIPLERAEADPAYAQAEALPGGGTIMERAASARGVTLPFDPKPADWFDPRQACPSS